MSAQREQRSRDTTSTLELTQTGGTPPIEVRQTLAQHGRVRLLHDTENRTATATGCGADPIAASLARADAALPHYQVRRGLPDHSDRPWWRCADVLAAPTALDHWRSALDQWMRARYGEAPERTVAGYLMCWYLATPARLAGQIFHAERRIPSLRPTDLAFRLAGHRPRPDGIAVLSAEFTCLPDDPAAGHPNATVVADEAALAASLRVEFADHARRFVAAFGPSTRLGTRTLWAAATDALDEALWLAGRQHGDEHAGARDAALVLPGKLPPFTSGSTLIDSLAVPANEVPARTWTRRRESCCFHYALTNGCGPCVTCPRLAAGNPDRLACARGQGGGSAGRCQPESFD